MKEPADLQRMLRDSVESRKRAWKALQGIRAVLRAADECDLPPPSHPPCFEAEGQALRRALAETVFRLLSDLEELKAAIEALHPAIGSSKDRPDNFPQLLIRLNRTLVKPHVASAALSQFRR
jgi:hypothetical protein